MLVEVDTDRGKVWINPAQVLRIQDIAGVTDCDLALIVGDTFTVKLNSRQLAMKINEGMAAQRDPIDPGRKAGK